LETITTFKASHRPFFLTKLFDHLTGRNVFGYRPVILQRP
jgi:hypothetical protein